MVNFLPPWSPQIILLGLRQTRQLLLSGAFLLPAGSSVTFLVQPPAGTMYIIGGIVFGIPRDAITGNPVYSMLIWARSEHTYIQTTYGYGIDSVVKEGIPSWIPALNEDPVIVTINNGTAAAVTWDLTLLVGVVKSSLLPVIQRMWYGMQKMVYMLGGLEEDDLEKLNLPERLLKNLPKFEAGG